MKKAVQYCPIYPYCHDKLGALILYPLRSSKKRSRRSRFRAISRDSRLGACSPHLAEWGKKSKTKIARFSFAFFEIAIWKVPRIVYTPVGGRGGAWAPPPQLGGNLYTPNRDFAIAIWTFFELERVLLEQRNGETRSKTKIARFSSSFREIATLSATLRVLRFIPPRGTGVGALLPR